jgi:hypothetical protein
LQHIFFSAILRAATICGRANYTFHLVNLYQDQRIMKRILLVFLCFFWITAFAACEKAAPTDDQAFCTSFEKAASCYCSSSLPAGMCGDMDTLYARMIFTFGTLETACALQKYTSQEDCVSDWNCYRKGISSHGRTCLHACQ